MKKAKHQKRLQTKKPIKPTVQPEIEQEATNTHRGLGTIPSHTTSRSASGDTTFTKSWR